MLAATITNQATDLNNIAEDVKTEEVQNTENLKREEQEREVQKQLNTTKEIVQDYFSDVPIMVDVAYCESRYTQFNEDGSVHRGVINPADVGVMQINEKYHLETSLKLGIDIHTFEGNMDYARYLYETQGTGPWEYSSHCWNKNREVALN